MEELVIEGERYRATFQNVRRNDDSKTYEYSCWNTSPKMWWEGEMRVIDKSEQGDIRTFFKTYPRSDVPNGIRNETFEQSLLLVRGENNGRYFNLRIGNDIIPDKDKAVDYLLGRLYEEASGLGEEKVFPKINIPLIELSDLVEQGLVLELISN
mgnify:CR=1 FL=1